MVFGLAERRSERNLAEDMALIGFQFVLLTIGGAIVANFYQGQLADRERGAERRDRSRTEAVAAFDEVSRLLDRRLYRTRRLVWGMQEGVGTEAWNARRLAYDAAVVDWNENLNRNLALIQVHFGCDLRSKLSGEIFPRFRSISSELTDKPTLDELSHIHEQINDLNAAVEAFDVEMLERIERNAEQKQVPSKPTCKPVAAVDSLQGASGDT